MEGKNRWWWVDSHHYSKPTRSSWLQSTLSDLDEKTKAMIKLIEEDADSFAQRAEMYYRKRPELIAFVKEFYQAHRSLAERYDQLKTDYGSSLLTKSTSSLCFTKSRVDKLMSSMERSYDNSSETSDHEECGKSEVDDHEQDGISELNKVEEEEEEEEEKEVGKYEVMKLREEIEKIKKENKLQVEMLRQKDEEKREAIRQLSFAMDVVKEDNTNLRKIIVARLQENIAL